MDTAARLERGGGATRGSPSPPNVGLPIRQFVGGARTIAHFCFGVLIFAVILMGLPLDMFVQHAALQEFFDRSDLAVSSDVVFLFDAHAGSGIARGYQVAEAWGRADYVTTCDVDSYKEVEE